MSCFLRDERMVNTPEGRGLIRRGGVLVENVFDNQTGMLNLKAFETDCQKKLSTNIEKKYAAVFVRLSNLRRFLSTSGFASTYIFIKSAANAVRRLFPSPLENCCHYSLESFCILVEYKKDCIQRLQDLQTQIRLIAPEDYLDIKAGICLIEEKNTLKVHELFSRARYCCESLLQDHKTHIAFFDESMERKLELEHHIREYFTQATASGELTIALQPIVSTQEHKVYCYEALARWNDKRYGPISPGLFVKVLEKAGMIHLLDLFTAKKACELARAIYDHCGIWTLFSINLSRLDFEVCDICEEIRNILEITQVPASTVCIEITETMLSNDEEKFKQALALFKKRNHQIWIDDFGSGYSSFNVLKDYDFDVIKLDLRFFEGFFTNPKSSKIVSSVLHMARDIGVKSLAEGIEQPECIEFLQREQCDLIQGFFISKPIPFEELLHDSLT